MLCRPEVLTELEKVGRVREDEGQSSKTLKLQGQPRDPSSTTERQPCTYELAYRLAPWKSIL